MKALFKRFEIKSFLDHLNLSPHIKNVVTGFFLSSSLPSAGLITANNGRLKRSCRPAAGKLEDRKNTITYKL
jgi:hypothetical protein